MLAGNHLELADSQALSLAYRIPNVNVGNQPDTIAECVGLRRKNT